MLVQLVLRVLGCVNFSNVIKRVLEKLIFSLLKIGRLALYSDPRRKYHDPQKYSFASEQSVLLKLSFIK
jgi:hypothetical protein